MLRHLRLARERGSLKAPNHPVQDEALSILQILDEKDRAAARLDMVKGLVILGPREGVKAQFPEYFDPFEEAKQEDGTYDIDLIDGADVEWETPGSVEDDNDLARWIAERESGSVSAADFD